MPKKSTHVKIKAKYMLKKATKIHVKKASDRGFYRMIVIADYGKHLSPWTEE